jgi:hypothetical protein
MALCTYMKGRVSAMTDQHFDDHTNEQPEMAGKTSYTQAELNNRQAASEVAVFSALELLQDGKVGSVSGTFNIAITDAAAKLNLKLSDKEQNLSVIVGPSAAVILEGDEPVGAIRHGVDKYSEPFVKHMTADGKPISKLIELCLGAEDGFQCNIEFTGPDNKPVRGTETPHFYNSGAQTIYQLKTEDANVDLGTVTITEDLNHTDGSISGTITFEPQR